MKKQLLLVIFSVILMTACGKNKNISDSIVENEMIQEIVMSTESTYEMSEVNENFIDSEIEKDNPYEKTKYIKIDLSDTKEIIAEGDVVVPMQLEIISEENNNVSMADDWYFNMNMSLPMIGDSWECFFDDKYEYQWMGEELHIYEKKTGDCLYVLQYPTDKWYVNGPNAYLKDGIFYGGSVQNGYVSPNSCYMFAYDLDNEKLVWRSADQTYNTMNFIVKENIIICGYGFTSEKDYLYQLNINTGEVIDKIELKKMPDLLVEQEGKLYVHTYSYDYIIQVLGDF